MKGPKFEDFQKLKNRHFLKFFQFCFGSNLKISVVFVILKLERENLKISFNSGPKIGVICLQDLNFQFWPQTQFNLNFSTYFVSVKLLSEFDIENLAQNVQFYNFQKLMIR